MAGRSTALATRMPSISNTDLTMGYNHLHELPNAKSAHRTPNDELHCEAADLM